MKRRIADKVQNPCAIILFCYVETRVRRLMLFPDFCISFFQHSKRYLSHRLVRY